MDKNNVYKIHRKTKIRAFITIMIATCAEIAIIMLILWSKTFNLPKWSAIGGSVGFITGIVFVYNFIYFSFPKQAFLLKFAVILNPGVTLIFAGITLLLINFSKSKIFFFICGFLLILSILSSFVSYCIYSFKKNKDWCEKKAEEKDE